MNGFTDAFKISSKTSEQIINTSFNVIKPRITAFSPLLVIIAVTCLAPVGRLGLINVSAIQCEIQIKSYKVFPTESIVQPIIRK